MAIALIIIVLSLVYFAVCYFSFALTCRRVGIKISTRDLLVPVLIVALTTLTIRIAAYPFDHSLSSPFFVVLSLVAPFYFWNVIMKRRANLPLAKTGATYLISTVIVVFISAVLAIASTFVVEHYRVSGASMSTYSDGDRVLVIKLNKFYSEGTAVVYHSSDRRVPGQLIGRIQGRPGEVVRPPTNYVNNSGKLVDPNSYKLQANEYLVIGDNAAKASAQIVSSGQIVGVVGPTIYKKSQY